MLYLGWIRGGNRGISQIRKKPGGLGATKVEARVTKTVLYYHLNCLLEVNLMITHDTTFEDILISGAMEIVF